MRTEYEAMSTVTLTAELWTIATLFAVTGVLSGYVVTPNNTVVMSGDRVRLNCSYQPDGIHKIDWQMANNELHSIVDLRPVCTAVDQSRLTTYTNNVDSCDVEFTVSNDYKSVGVYYCHVRNSTGIIQAASFLAQLEPTTACLHDVTTKTVTCSGGFKHFELVFSPPPSAWFSCGRLGEGEQVDYVSTGASGLRTYTLPRIQFSLAPVGTFLPPYDCQVNFLFNTSGFTVDTVSATNVAVYNLRTQPVAVPPPTKPHRVAKKFPTRRCGKVNTSKECVCVKMENDRVRCKHPWRRQLTPLL